MSGTRVFSKMSETTATRRGDLDGRGGLLRAPIPVLIALLIAMAAFCVTPAHADQPTAQKASSASTARAHKVAKPSAATQTVLPPVGPPAPPKPDWPVNDKPATATVVWNSRGLQIDAANSSLQQILKDVATATGAKVTGLGGDQRIFGTYGPGAARDVLSELLVGSGYNVLMVGDQGQGTPRQIVLSKVPTGPAAASTNSQSQNYDEGGASPDVEEQPQPPPPPPAQQPPSAQPQGPQNPQQNPNGFGPGAPPRTPQQILQEMQQRQQQIEQMQLQQRNNNPQ